MKPPYFLIIDLRSIIIDFKSIVNRKRIAAKSEKAQQETMAKLKDCDLDTAKAYRMRLILQEIYRYPVTIAPMVLQDWIQWDFAVG
jgi:hypothetical protein